MYFIFLEKLKDKKILILKMDIYKFHLKVVDIIDKIFVYNTDHKLLNEMTLVYEKDGSKIFNGEIPNTFKKVLLKLIGLEGTTQYNFENLFSLPLEFETKQKNTIIINTPEEIKDVIIETTMQLSSILNIPNTFFMTDVVKAKINLFPEKTTNQEKMSRGVDPMGKTFIKYVDIDLNKYQHIKPEITKIIKNTLFTVRCYRHSEVRTLEIS